MTDPKPFFDALFGKVVSHVWRGHGSAIFIEFGQLTPKKPKNNSEMENPRGELTLMIEWSWRIERKYSILAGSWSSDKKWPEIFKKLINAKVIEVELFGYLPEIVVSLSNGLRVSSFMTADGQPQWVILTKTPIMGSLNVKRGRLSIEADS